jgi:hypothetical protein
VTPSLAFAVFLSYSPACTPGVLGLFFEKLKNDFSDQLLARTHQATSVGKRSFVFGNREAVCIRSISVYQR